MDNYLDSPIFICGHRKGGTTMLINMLDNAKDAIVYPDDSSFFYLYYPRFESSQYTNREKISRIKDIIIDEVLYDIINDLNIDEKDKQELLVKKHEFGNNVIDDLKTCDFINSKNILLTIIKNLQNTFYKNNTPKVWIEKTTSTEIYALDLIKLFPNAKFVHVIRDPRDNWASLNSGWDQRYSKMNDDKQRVLHSMFERAKLGLEFAKNNQTILGKDKYHIIKYEDLTTQPEYYMKIIADFIGIDFNQNLLIPTTFGYSWQGNNFEGVKFKKASNKNVGRWKERIPKEEAMLIEYHFKDIMDHFGYERCYNLLETVNMAKEHYKWSNFSTPYSAK